MIYNLLSKLTQSCFIFEISRKKCFSIYFFLIVLMNFFFLLLKTRLLKSSSAVTSPTTQLYITRM